MSLFGTILCDIRAKARWCYGDESRRSVLKAGLTDGTPAMILYRAMQWSQRNNLRPLAMIFNKLNAICCGCVIGRGADFGAEFVLIHSNGTVINSSVRGGSGIHLEHQVTIGADRGQSPALGSDIFIGAGAKVIGNVHIGDHVRIGANAVVVDDVPDHHTAVGVPARCIAHATDRRAA